MELWHQGACYNPRTLLPKRYFAHTPRADTTSLMHPTPPATA